MEVKYNNELNLLWFEDTKNSKSVNLSAHQNRMIQLILTFTRNDYEEQKKKNILEKFFNRETRTIEIEFAKFFQLVNGYDWKKSISEIGSMVDELLKKILHSILTYEDENRKVMFVCFEKAEYIKHEQIVRITFQKDFYDMVTNYKNGFTLFELQEFFALQSSYSQALYRLLKQYRQTGKVTFFKDKWNQFCKVMNIPESYRMCDIDARVLKPAIAELTRPLTLFDQERIIFRGLKYEKIRASGRGSTGRGQGGKVIGIVFSFEPEPEVRVEFKEAQQKLEQQEQEQTQNDYFLDREALKKRLDVARYTSIYINGVSYKIEAVEPILYKTGDLVIGVSIRDEEMNPSSIQFTSEQEFFNWYESVKE